MIAKSGSKNDSLSFIIAGLFAIMPMVLLYPYHIVKSFDWLRINGANVDGVRIAHFENHSWVLPAIIVVPLQSQGRLNIVLIS